MVRGARGNPRRDARPRRLRRDDPPGGGPLCPRAERLTLVPIYDLLAGRARPAGEAAWNALVERAIREGLGPLLYERLRADPPPAAAPPAAMARLAKARRAGVRSALRGRALLAAALRAIEGAGVEAVVLKGRPLAAAWGDDTLRPSDDCDLLVWPADRARASAALVAAGFKSVGHHAEIHAGRLGAVDLHVDLVNADRISARAAAGLRTDLVWPRVRSAAVDGLTVRLLHPEDEIVYLAAHAVLHHGLGRPLLLVDLDRLLASPWDPASLAARAEVLGGARWLRLALEARRLALGAEASDLHRPLARSAPPSRLERSLLVRVLRRKPHPSDRYLFALLGMSRWRDRLAFIRQAAAPAPALLREVAAARGRRRPIPLLYMRHAAVAVTGCGNLLAAALGSALSFGSAEE